MASQEEDNKLECISNVNKEQERYFLNVYKKHECILNNKNESFENKVESLIDVWKSVGELNLSQFDIRHVIQIMDWAKLHALNIVLTAEWNAFKASHQSRLLHEIEKAQNELLKLNSGFATRCKKLADVVKNPWEDAVLMTLMKTKDAEIGPAEIEFFCVETAYVISVRLKKLCESQCEDLALNLVTAFMNCNKLSKTQNFSLNATEIQMWFIFDIYIALLYKFQERQKIVILLKELTFEEGLQLVKRFAKKRVKISKIWKNCHRVAVLATQMYISQAVVKYTEDLKETLENYIDIYISLCNTENLLQDFTTSIRRISNLADAAGLYVFCDVIQKKAGTRLKPLVIEMYIRALTTDMNDLERQKDANDKEKVAAITSRLAGAFCTLADFLDEHVKVARECVLTAFSLDPTKQRLQNIETLARRSGYQVLDTGQEWKCKLHPPVLPSDDIAWMCPECGDWMCKPQLNIPLKINMALNEALQNSVLGISEALCDDLVVCLSNPRYQILSWFLPWADLHRLCIMYLQDPQTTKNFVTELKFVDIDYSIFKGIKREPLDELAGIERGYEQYLDQDFVSDEETSSVSGDSMSQDSRPYSLGSDGAGEGPYLPLLPPQPKSDPNTLKSLRMFRPNLKRLRTSDCTDNHSEKLHKADPTAVMRSPICTVTSNFKDPPKNAAAGNTSLSNFLNGISTSRISTVKSENQDTHSKNVKVATLPPLGGQVANKEIKSIQVLLQPLKNPQSSKNPVDQALKPYNQSSSTITETTKKELMLKLLNKPSLSGSKENNSHKVLNSIKTPDSSLPTTAEARVAIKTPTKINKEHKISSTSIHPNLIKMQSPVSSGIVQGIPPITLEKPPNLTDLDKVQVQPPKQDRPQNNVTKQEWSPIVLYPYLYRQPSQSPSSYQLPNSTQSMDKTQNLVPKLENSNIRLQNNSQSREREKNLYVVPPNMQEKHLNKASSSTPLVQENIQKDAVLTQISVSNSDIPQTSLESEKPQSELGRIQMKSSSNLAAALFPKLEKPLINLNKNQTVAKKVEETQSSPNLDRLIHKPDRMPCKQPFQEKLQLPISQNSKTIQPCPETIPNQAILPERLHPVPSPVLERVQMNPDRIEAKLSPPLIEKLQSSKCPNSCPHMDKTQPLIPPSSESVQQTPLSQEKTMPLPHLNREKIQINPERILPSLEETSSNSKETQCNVDRTESKLNPDKTLAIPPSQNLVESLLSSKVKNNSNKLTTDNYLSSFQVPCLTGNKEVFQKIKNQIASIVEEAKGEAKLKSDSSGCVLDKVYIRCNNVERGEGNVQIEQNACRDSNAKNCMDKRSRVLEKVAQHQMILKNCLGIIDDGIFSDLTESKPEELFFQNNNDYSSFGKDVNVFESGLDEELPKNFNLTENIRTYVKKPTRKLPVVNKDCIKIPNSDLDICKNLYTSSRNNNNSSSSQNLHSNVQKLQDSCKELKVVLYRLSSNTIERVRAVSNMTEALRNRQKCDRGKTPPKHVRRRKSTDKSENKTDKVLNRVQNHKLSSPQDINPKVLTKENSKSCCDGLNKLNNVFEESMIPRVLLERIHIDSKSYARSVLANVPGLNDYQMIRPTNVNHIVNVVQVSGNRSNQNVPIQNTQTSTQVSPHIQRIGQPRVVDQKPEHSDSITATTTSIPTTTTAKATTTQPSTLINILSQQIIRPVTTQSSAVRRQAPLINILSQQIIRPSQTQKTPATPCATTTENQVKPATSEQTANSQVNNVVKNTTGGLKSASPTTTGQGSTILQFICKSSLPKFQQAFGKSVYQNTTETSSTVTNTIETPNVAADTKKPVTKTVPINVQPMQGSVIYSRQVPVGQTISLIPPGGTTRQVFRIATSNSEQISLVKDSVIHSKMSALLAAALQARPKNSEQDQVGLDDKVTLTRPTLVQNARIVKPVQLQIPSSVVRTTPHANLSSTTLEQLREFDMVYKQIKERSGSTVPAESANGPPDNQEITQQRISVTYVNQLQKYTQLSPVVVVSSYSNLQPAASPALSVTSQGSSSPCVTPAPTPTLPKIATKTSKGKTLKNTTNNSTTKSSPIPKPQQKPQEDEHTTQRIFDILAEYAEQLRNSPDLNNKPAPRRRSNPPTNPSQNSKRKKSSSTCKKSSQSNNTIDIDADDITVGSEDSSGGGIVQLSVTDDEQSQAATINTPESTGNTSPSSSRQVILTETGTCGNQSRNLIIADSSVGEALKMPNTAVIVPGSYIMPVSMVKGGQQIAVVSGGSKILATVPARSGQNMLLFQSFMNQNRKGGISAVKYSTIQPISGISSQSLAGVSAQPPVILPSTAVALGQPLTLKKLNDDRDNNELLLTVSLPKEESKHANDVPLPDSSTSVSSDSNDIKIEEATLPSGNTNEKIFQTYQKSVITNSVATSVIATTSTTGIKEHEENTSQNIINMNLTSANIKGEPKANERMQSVLVTACSSNGPMLSHTTPRYRKPTDTERINNNDLPNKEEFLHNREKTSNNEQKTYRSSTVYYTNKTKKNCTESQKIDSEMQKQAAIERELRLQKSLSEECEDLGVDEPSTSDLFPEADLLFDSNHSPSFDQSSQDIIKRAPQASEIKEEVKAAMNLFSDDENSSSLRTDLFEYVEYQTVETALDYQARQLMNGNTTSNESGSSGCEDNTLLAKCATMSEVTLNSPISPEMYTESSLNKYKFKYSNRKKGERGKQSDFCGEVVSSSEDTIGSLELGKINCDDDNFKVVHVAITKADMMKDEGKCELHCDDDLDSPSGRGARRSVRKLCSCCNGSQDGNISRKRPHSSRPHTPATPHKKAFLNKKR